MVPTIKERLKAIDMDNRMDGSYRATAQPGEPTAVPAAQNETGGNPPANQSDETQQNATKHPVRLPGTIYVPVTNNKIEKPASGPRILPPAPFLNTPRFSAENNKLQQPGWLQTVRL
jgi:hypothetical protein